MDSEEAKVANDVEPILTARDGLERQQQRRLVSEDMSVQMKVSESQDCTINDDSASEI